MHPRNNVHPTYPTNHADSCSILLSSRVNPQNVSTCGKYLDRLERFPAPSAPSRASNLHGVGTDHGHLGLGMWWSFVAACHAEFSEGDSNNNHGFIWKTTWVFRCFLSLEPYSGIQGVLLEHLLNGWCSSMIICDTYKGFAWKITKTSCQLSAGFLKQLIRKIFPNMGGWV